MSYGQPPYGSPPPPPGGGEPPYGSGAYPPYGGGQPPYGGGQPPYGDGWPPHGGYNIPGYGGQMPPQTSAMAVTALVLGIVGLLGFCFCYGILGLPGLILGIIAMKEIKASNGAKTGHGMALAGSITGGIGLALGVLMFVAFLALQMSPGMFDQM